jgi:hypothetical protein
MLYKYRIQISLVLIVVLSIFLCANFGYTGCSDGWSSSSIGKRGACSHHGGVTSNIFLLLVISFIASALFYAFIDSRYRVYANLVVLNTLPVHPLEAELKKSTKFISYKLPISEAKSKKEFNCFYCKLSFKAGNVYKYYFKGSERIKYCLSCSANLHEINSEILNNEKAYNELRNNQHETVYNYYLKNAKAKLN